MSDRFAVLLQYALPKWHVTRHGVVNSVRAGALAEWCYADRNIVPGQGEEMGRFLLGSTIVMLFQARTIVFDKSWMPERPVRLGERMGDRPD